MDVIIQRDVLVEMRDGTRLRADIYRPDVEGEFPAVMQRTPYGKDQARLSGVLDPVLAAAEGLVVVAQDTRGQGISDGEAFYPFRDDFMDGYDTAEWIARLPFSNGRVGAYGVSYGGNAAWQAAVAQPPSLGAIAPTMSPIDWVEGWQMLTRGDVLKWGLTLAWTLDHIVESQVRRFSADGDVLAERLADLAELIDDFDQLARTTPMTSVGDILRSVIEPSEIDGGSPLAYFDDVVSRRGVGAWEHLDLERSHARVTVPVNLTAGWYDVILDHDLTHFRRMRDESPAGDRTTITIGPWSHSNFTNVVGELDYGRRSTAGSLDLGASRSAELVAWFGATLSGDDIDELASPVRVFMQGANRWRVESDWPPPTAVYQSWYFSAGGQLLVGPSDVEPAWDAFVYDPNDPCPTRGGDLVKPPTYVPGPVDQTPILSRRDVLCYRSDVLAEPIDVLGPVRARLVTATSGRGTDWVVKLCDEHPDGRVFNVCDGIERVSTSAVLTEVDVDLWSTGIVFEAGHRICVIVTSSDFPRYDRNPNTGVHPWEATSFEPALQRVFHSLDHRSRIELPVIT